MKIAVCDDERTARESIVALLDEYCIERKVNVDYVCFSDYETLAPRINEFDCFILDYMTPGTDGLTFAQTVRDVCGTDKTIIFITSYPEIVYDSFKVRAYRFLLKPIRRADLFEALDGCLRGEKGDKTLTLRTDGSTEVIRVNSICFIEAVGRDSVVATDHGSVFCHRTISWFEAELNGLGFYRTHRSFLINLKKIKRFDSSGIELTNGQTVGISTRKYKAFCSAYLEMK